MSISLAIDLDGKTTDNRRSFFCNVTNYTSGRPRFGGKKEGDNNKKLSGILQRFTAGGSNKYCNLIPKLDQLFFRRGLARYFRRKNGDGSKDGKIVNLLEESETMAGEGTLKEKVLEGNVCDKGEAVSMGNCEIFELKYLICQFGLNNRRRPPSIES